MITGEINADREPIVRLQARSVNLAWKEIEILLDTGFTEFLALPQSLIDELALPQIDTQNVKLVDGNIITCTVHVGTILWDGQERIVPIQASQSEALLGMAMIHDHQVFLDVVHQGIVTITAHS